MKVIIAGSRNITDQYFIYDHLNDISCAINIMEVVSGMAKGPDSIGAQWAEEHYTYVKEFPADWDTHGKKAGILRNIQMGDYADALIAFWDGKSRGTKHMIDYMLSLGKEVHVYVDKAA